MGFALFHTSKDANGSMERVVPGFRKIGYMVDLTDVRRFFALVRLAEVVIAQWAFLCWTILRCDPLTCFILRHTWQVVRWEGVVFSASLRRCRCLEVSDVFDMMILSGYYTKLDSTLGFVRPAKA